MVYVAAKNLNRLDDDLILRIVFQKTDVVTGYSLVEREVDREMLEFRLLLFLHLDVLLKFYELFMYGSDLFSQLNNFGGRIMCPTPLQIPRKNRPDDCADNHRSKGRKNR